MGLKLPLQIRGSGREGKVGSRKTLSPLLCWFGMVAVSVVLIIWVAFHYSDWIWNVGGWWAGSINWLRWTILH